MEQILKHSKYIDPMIDVAFKQIFGKEKNKRLIKELLEHVFHQDITELEFVNVEHPGESKDDRKAVFDLQCKSRQIGDFIVEVQVKNQGHFDKRAIYYSTFPITAQAPRGDWDYDFKPVFFLGILNYKMEGQSDGGGEYIHRYSIRNDENGQRLTDSLQFVFMELAGFDKRLQDCKSFEDKFLYFFKNLPKFAMKPDTQNDSYFDELLAAAEYSNMTKAEQEAYNRRLKIQRDNYAADKYARETAIAEGLAKGEAAKARSIAKGLIEEGISIEVIQRVTGLSVEEIEALK
jgi:predicted transposase/invertase (TIGR01784 family)